MGRNNLKGLLKLTSYHNLILSQPMVRSFSYLQQVKVLFLTIHHSIPKTIPDIAFHLAMLYELTCGRREPMSVEHRADTAPADTTYLHEPFKRK
jgi:hypothetical protein